MLPAAEKSKSDWLVNTTDETFQADVFERSKSGLVLVDFWAEWCAPCRTLAPTLEKLVVEFAGEVTLVKANTEATPQAASGFRVSGIPAVFAVLEGEVVDAFQGVMSEAEIRIWIHKQLAYRTLIQAKSFLASDPKAAETLLLPTLEAAPNNAEVLTLLAEAYLNQDRDAESAAVIEKLEERGFLEPAAEKVKAAIDVKRRGGLSVADARSALVANPQSFALQFALAEALVGSQEYEAAFEICLNLVAQDRKLTGEQGRQLMVEVFRILPDDSPLTSDYRRKLSMAMY